MYRNTEVKARIQFELYEDDTFEATFLAFNEVPQLSLFLNILINNAFEDYKDNNNTVKTTLSNSTISADDFSPIKSLNDSNEIVHTETQSLSFTTAENNNRTTENQEKSKSFDVNDNVKVKASEEPVQNKSNSSAYVEELSPYLTGQISSGGAAIEGYTSDYVCSGGAKSRQWICEDTWHITAHRIANSHGTTWYECWDTDDGDYYGWIDSDYLYFYSDNSNNNYIDSYPVIESVSMYGQFNTHGSILPGYSTDYLVYNGEYEAIRQSLGHEWHIIALNRCYTRGTNWYECWDSDDGDYYGWVNDYNIDFY